MKQSESIRHLAEAMSNAQAQMGAAIKGATNPFFNSKYADLGSVIQAIKPHFADVGLSYVQFPVSADNAVGVTTRLMHCSGEWLEQDYFIPLGKMDAQAAGSAITYARRYALQAIAGIPSEDDDGNTATQAAPQFVTKAQAKTIADLIDKTGSDKEKFCKAFKCESIDKLSVDHYAKAKDLLEQKL